MALVNVPPQQVPQEVLDENPNLAKYLIDLNHYNWQMWKRTGGGNDAIEGITSSESFENSFSSGSLQEQICDLMQTEDLIPIQKEWSCRKATQNTVITDHEIVEANNGITVTVDPSPGHDDEIIVANGDGSQIKINFNGQKVNHTRLDDRIVTSNRGTSLRFKFFSEGPYWRII